MRYFDTRETITSLSASSNRRAFDIKHLQGFSVAANITNTSGFSATFKVQASNNAFLDNVNNNEDPNSTWEDLPGGTFTIATNTSFMFNTESAYYSAFRLVITVSSGSADAAIRYFAKGVI